MSRAGDCHARGKRTLQTIAEILEIPVTAFFAPLTLNPDRERQAAELPTAFDRIRDPDEPDAGLSFVRARAAE